MGTDMCLRAKSASRSLPIRTSRIDARRKHTPPTMRSSEEVTQVNLSMRMSLRKELMALANEADMTMRAYVLNALKERGLSVEPDDLDDMRKRRG